MFSSKKIMITAAVITQLALYILYILIPLLVLYFIYLMVTKAFNDMGFSSFEAIVIVFISFLLGSGLLDTYVGIQFSAIPIFEKN